MATEVLVVVQQLLTLDCNSINKALKMPLSEARNCCSNLPNSTTNTASPEGGACTLTTTETKISWPCTAMQVFLKATKVDGGAWDASQP